MTAASNRLILHGDLDLGFLKTHPLNFEIIQSATEFKQAGVIIIIDNSEFLRVDGTVQKLNAIIATVLEEMINNHVHKIQQLPFITDYSEDDVVFYDNMLAFYPSRVRLCLIENNMKFRHVFVDTANGKALKPEFLRINPNATLPVLVYQGKAYSESKEIIIMLDQIHAKSKTMDTKLTEWVDLLCSWNGNTWFYSHMNTLVREITRRAKLTKIAKCEKYTIKYPKYASVYADKISDITQTATEEQITANDAILKQILEKSEQALGKVLGLDQPTYRQDYIAGNEYSLADLLLTTIMVRIESVGTLDTYLAKLPLLGLWYARMQARPSYNLAFQRRQKMLATLGLIPAIAASFSIK